MVAAGTLVAGAAGALCQRVLHIGPAGCLLRTTLGIPCPLCGLSTVGVKLLRCDVIGAVRHDALGSALIALLSVMTIGLVLRLRFAWLLRPAGRWAWALPVAVLALHWVATVSGVVALAPLR